MKYDIYKPAYILLGKYKYRTESGIKINYKDFSFEFIALDEPFLFKIYKEAVNFDIIGCDGNNYILLHPCRLSQIDMNSINNFEWEKNSILQSLKKLDGDSLETK